MLAEKLADAPEHKGLLPVTIVTPMEGVSEELTVIVMPELVAVLELTQIALDVMLQVTIAPLVIVLLVYVAEVVPTFSPFTCH